MVTSRSEIIISISKIVDASVCLLDTSSAIGLSGQTKCFTNLVTHGRKPLDRNAVVKVTSPSTHSYYQ